MGAIKNESKRYELAWKANQLNAKGTTSNASMGDELNIVDVCNGHHLAQKQLAALRDKCRISRRVLEGLRNAYIDSQIQASHPGYLADRLDTWVEGVMEEAGMMEEVRQKVRAACERRRIKIIPNGDE